MYGEVKYFLDRCFAQGASQKWLLNHMMERGYKRRMANKHLQAARGRASSSTPAMDAAGMLWFSVEVEVAEEHADKKRRLYSTSQDEADVGL